MTDERDVDGEVLTFGKRPADDGMCTETKRPVELSPRSFSRVK